MRTLGVILLIAIIVALLTVPGQNKFNNYLAKKGKDSSKCMDSTSVRHYSYKVFSIDYVDYCVPFNDSEPTSVGLKTHTDKYLGLFGLFFKL